MTEMDMATKDNVNSENMLGFGFSNSTLAKSNAGPAALSTKPQNMQIIWEEVERKNTTLQYPKNLDYIQNCHCFSGIMWPFTTTSYSFSTPFFDFIDYMRFLQSKSLNTFFVCLGGSGLIFEV